MRRARRARGLTQAELARALGVSGKERISSWENETSGPQVGQIPQLARILEVSPDTLLVGDPHNRLRELRWAAGLSVGEVAERLHVNRNTYQRWETRTRAFPEQPQLFQRLATVLQVSERELRAAVDGIDLASPTRPLGRVVRRRPGPASGGAETEAETDDPGLPGLAAQLNHLFATVPRSAGSSRPHSNDTAAGALEEYGIRVTGHALAHFRAGRRTNPSARLLAGIARLFGVPIAYFFDPDLEREVNQQLESLVATRDARVKDLLMQGVNPRRLEQVEGILEQIRRLDGLKVSVDGEPPPP